MSDRPASEMIVHSEHDGRELAPIVETSSAAMGELARARVQARSVVAMNRPRDMDMVRIKLLKECARPGFAAVARYSLPRGGKNIVGPTIRFAEAAARMLGNLDVFAEVIFDDANKRILQITAVDLESNHSESMPVVVDKIMERKKLGDKEVALGTRTNSSGDLVYIVAVPESEMPVRQGAAVAKIRRNLILAHLPGDILEEATRAVAVTLAKIDKSDPDAARKALVDAFATVGVLPDALKAYLGCDIAAAGPMQLDELRAVYNGIREGEATWAEVLKEKTGADGSKGAGGTVDKLKAQLADKLKKKEDKAKGGAGKPANEKIDGATGEAKPVKDCDGEHGDPACGTACYLAPPPAGA